MDISAVSEPILIKQRWFCHLNCMFFQIWQSVFQKIFCVVLSATELNYPRNGLNYCWVCLFVPYNVELWVPPCSILKFHRTFRYFLSRTFVKKNSGKKLKMRKRLLLFSTIFWPKLYRWLCKMNTDVTKNHLEIHMREYEVILKKSEKKHIRRI